MQTKNIVDSGEKMAASNMESVLRPEDDEHERIYLKCVAEQYHFIKDICRLTIESWNPDLRIEVRNSSTIIIQIII